MGLQLGRSRRKKKKKKSKKKKKDNNAQEAHESIRPTKIDVEKLVEKEKLPQKKQSYII